MIILLVLGLLVAIFTAISAYFGQTTLATIPYFGADLQEALTTMILYWNSAEETVPYLEPLWNYFLFGVIGFETLMLVLRIVLGSRTPTRDA